MRTSEADMPFLASACCVFLAGCGVSSSIVKTPDGSWRWITDSLPWRSCFEDIHVGLHLEHRFIVGSRTSVYGSGSIVFFDMRPPTPDMPLPYADDISDLIAVPRAGGGVLYAVADGVSTQVRVGAGLRLAVWPEFVAGARINPGLWRFTYITSTSVMPSIPLSIEITHDVGIRGRLAMSLEYDLAFTAPGWGLEAMSDNESDPFRPFSLRIGYHW